MEYRNGKTRLSDYKNLDVKIDFSRVRKVDKLNLTFGGMMSSNIDDYLRQFSVLKHSIRQIIYNRSKDGYYKPDFLFIPKIPFNYRDTGSGLVYFELFLYLEEYYYKDFIVEHIKSVMEDVDDLYSQNKYFTFKKYKPNKRRKICQEAE